MATASIPILSHEIAMNKPFKESFSLYINQSIHPKDAVIRTCYALSNIGKFWLREENGELWVDIKTSTPESCINNLTECFSTMLIDFTLRHTIEKKTKVVRDTIIKTALAEMI